MTGLRRSLMIVLQVTALGAGVWFIARTARANWTVTGALTHPVAPVPLVAATVLTALTYAGLVVAWTYSLRWWGSDLRFAGAARIWFLTNVARFIPGVVWQYASLAAMCAEQGVSLVAATGSLLLQQLVLLTTGVAVTVVVAPQLVSAWGLRADPSFAAICAVGVMIVLVAVFPRGLPTLGRIASRLAGRDVRVPVVPVGQLTLYVVGLVVPWLSYGVAFWLFARSLLGSAAPGLVWAAVAFVASYVAGILAVFAPGGIVVREAALVATLAPAVGGQSALLLAIGSRVWLVAVELLCALAAAFAGRHATGVRIAPGDELRPRNDGM